MDNSFENIVGLFLWFPFGNFNNSHQLLENGVIQRSKGTRGGNRTMRNKEGEFVKRILNFLKEVGGMQRRWSSRKPLGTKKPGNNR